MVCLVSRTLCLWAGGCGYARLPIALFVNASSHQGFFAEENNALYGNRYQEAVKIFNSLLSLESLADPIKEVQDILQKCFDIEDLQSEVTHIYVHVCAYMYVSMYMCVHTWYGTCVFTWYVRIYVHVCAYMVWYMCVHT